jgi:hypothetical protein
MKYVVVMGLGAMTYIPNFIKNGSTVQKMIWGGYTHLQTAW